MKIGVLTLPLHTNYGGILQAYALTTILKELGHEVWLIDKPNTVSIAVKDMPATYVKRLVKKYLLGKREVFVFAERKRNREYPIISQHTQQFIETYITPRMIVSSPRDIKKDAFNAIIVGSDQIWRPKYYPNIEDSFLGFAKDWQIKRIAYAPSFGSDSWEFTPQQTENCKQLLKLFDAVSVRESSGAKMCVERLGREAKHVLDPTMLLNKSSYVKIIENTPKRQGELLTYFLDYTSDKQASEEKIKHKYGYTIFRNNTKTEDKSAPVQERIAYPIETWIRGFFDAKFIITDSFHACVFSILFNKPFIVYGNRSRGVARFKSLLSTFGLESRLIFDSQELSNEKINSQIDWTSVNTILDQRKATSFDFLASSLGNTTKKKAKF